MSYQDSFYKTMLNNLHDGVYFVQNDRKITFWNKGAEMITGYTADEVVGSKCGNRILNHIDNNGRCLCEGGCPLEATLYDGVQRSTEVYLHHKDGHRVPVLVKTMPIYKGEKIVGSVEMFKDHTEWKETIEQMRHLEALALTDPLCNIPNRRYAETFIQSKLEEYEKLNIPFATAFVDVDNFKVINDTYGHDQGDLALRTLTKTITGILRKSDLVARWGGEEFVIVLVNVNEDEMKTILEKIRMLIAESNTEIVVGGKKKMLNFTISIGASIAEPEDTIDNLISRIDGLMYISKQNGKNRVSIG